MIVQKVYLPELHTCQPGPLDCQPYVCGWVVGGPLEGIRIIHVTLQHDGARLHLCLITACMYDDIELVS